MMAAKLLLRDWRGGQLSLVAVSIVLSVTIVTSVTLVADRVERGLTQQLSNFLAADLVVRSGVVIAPEYRQRADVMGLQTVDMVEFQSMAFAQDRNQLVSVKAVQPDYPLRGELLLTTQAFSSAAPTPHRTGPNEGEAWVDERLLPLLGIELGDAIEVGRATLKVTQLIVREPDRGVDFSLTGARLLMNLEDVTNANLLLPGSRASYSLMLVGEEAAIRDYRQWVDDLDDVHTRIRTPERAENRLQNTIDRGRGFLLLAGATGLMLAGVAQALASFRYAQRHTDQVALLKAWGVGAHRVRSLYFQQLLLLALGASVLGVTLGWLVHLFLLSTLASFLPLQLPNAGYGPFVTSALSGLVCVLGFTLPAIWQLPSIPPLRVLQRSLQAQDLSQSKRLIVGLVTLFGLLVFYTQQVWMPVYFMTGLAVVTAAIGVLGWGGFVALAAVSRSWSQSGRMGVANLLRRRAQTLLLLVSFSSGLMLLLIMLLVRGSLIDEWRMQVPEHAPNHFILNIAPWELENTQVLFEGRGLLPAGWYPIVRGRLTHRNGEAFSGEQLEQAEGARRELNLTWSALLPPENQLTLGHWWSHPDTDTRAIEAQALPGVSVEEDMAQQLGVNLGDRLRFSIGGQVLEAQVMSIRALNWENMNPNFYFIFAPGALDNYSPAWLTSVHIPDRERSVISDLLQQYPSVLVISLVEIIEQIQRLIGQASQGLEMMFYLVLLCGALVFVAAVASSFEERAREIAVMRTLGASKKRIQRATLYEFSILGLVSGVVAVLAAEACVALLQHFVFQLPIRLHPWVWLVGPVVGCSCVALLGYLQTRALVNTPPVESLRRYT